MTTNLITRYLEYKKKILISYALSLYIDREYKDYEIVCLQKYINNYVEVFYHHKFETLGTGVNPDKKAIEVEQEGMYLELLDDLQIREIIETNSSFNRKKEIIKETKEYAKAVIIFDQKKVTEETALDTISDIVTTVSRKLPVLQNAVTSWNKKYKNSEKITNRLIEEKQNFILKQTPYQENLWEITLLVKLKKINIYKHSLVKRVEQEENIEKKKLKIMLMILNQIILGQIIRKEEIGYYLLPIKENLWTQKEEIDEIFILLDDRNLKDHIYLGITWNQMFNSKRLQEKQRTGYHFACYQDFTHILDIPTKIDTIDSSGLFDYLIVTGYKDKDTSTIEKAETSIIKKIFFSKEG